MLVLSVPSVPSVRTLIFKTCTKTYRVVALRRGAYAPMTAWTKKHAIESVLVSR